MSPGSILRLLFIYFKTESNKNLNYKARKTKTLGHKDF